jgi:steroid 5-alpha reductase family enzyme
MFAAISVWQIRVAYFTHHQRIKYAGKSHQKVLYLNSEWRKNTICIFILQELTSRFFSSPIVSEEGKSENTKDVVFAFWA